MNQNATPPWRKMSPGLISDRMLARMRSKAGREWEVANSKKKGRASLGDRQRRPSASSLSDMRRSNYVDSGDEADDESALLRL